MGLVSAAENLRKNFKFFMIHFFFSAISCSPGGPPAPGRFGLFSGSHYMQRDFSRRRVVSCSHFYDRHFLTYFPGASS